MGLLDEAIREHLALKRGRGADPAEIAREEKEALGPPTRSTEPQAARAREERGEPQLDELATAFAPGDDAPRSGSEPGEPRLRLATDAPARDEPGPAHEGREDGTTGERPAAEPRLRITEEDLRERTAGAGAPSPPPEAPMDDAPAAHDEPVAPLPAPADYDAPLGRADTDDELHTDDFVFGDEDDDFFADEPDEPRADAPFAPPEPLPPEPPPRPARPDDPVRDITEPGLHNAPLGDDPAAAPLDQPTEQYALEDVEDAPRRPEPPAPDSAEEDEPEGEELLEETPEFLEETPDHDRLWFEQKPPRDFDF